MESIRFVDTVGSSVYITDINLQTVSFRSSLQT